MSPDEPPTVVTIGDTDVSESLIEARTSEALGKEGANSGGRSIRCDKFGEYFGGLLPIQNLTGPVVDFTSHYRQIVEIGGDIHTCGEELSEDAVQVLVAAALHSECG